MEVCRPIGGGYCAVLCDRDVDNDVFVRPLHGIHLLCYYWPSPKAKGLPVPPITLEICSRVSLFSHQHKSDFPNQLDPVCSAFIVSTTITTYTTTNIPTYWLLISRWYSVYEDEHVPRNNASISNDTMPLVFPRTKRSQIWPHILTYILYHKSWHKSRQRNNILHLSDKFSC